MEDSKVKEATEKPPVAPESKPVEAPTEPQESEPVEESPMQKEKAKAEAFRKKQADAFVYGHRDSIWNKGGGIKRYNPHQATYRKFEMRHEGRTPIAEEHPSSINK